jgi:hypothetical protein
LERDWTSYGAVTIVEAATKHAESIGDDYAKVQVRDLDQPNVVHEFNVNRTVKYVVTNPRQGAE